MRRILVNYARETFGVMLQMGQDIVVKQLLREEVHRNQQAEHYHQQVEAEVSRNFFLQTIHFDFTAGRKSYRQAITLTAMRRNSLLAENRPQAVDIDLDHVTVLDLFFLVYVLTQLGFRKDSVRIQHQIP